MSARRWLAGLWPWGVQASVCFAALSVFVLYPIGVLTTNSLLDTTGQLSLEGFQTVWNTPVYREAIANTIVLSLVVTTLATILGVMFAYLVARYEFPCKDWVAIIPISTIIIPEVIVGQSWLMVLGNNGIVTNLLSDAGVQLPSFYGWTGLIFSMTLIYYTYVYLGVLAAFRGFDGQLEEASLSLGAGHLATKVKVLLPTVLPAILVNALVVFTLVVGNFALSSMLGSRVPLLSVQTYSLFVSEMGGSPMLQSSLSLVSVFLVGIVLLVQKRIVEKKVLHMVQGRAPAPIRITTTAGKLYAVLTGSIIALSLLPLVMVFVGAFTSASGPVMHWGTWSTRSLERAVLQAPEPIINSLVFAAAATLIGTLFAVLVSYLIVKRKSTLSSALDYIVIVPLTISGTVLGIALVQSFNTGALVLTGTAYIMVLCYVVRRLPFAVKSASSSLFNVPSSIEEASISLGVTPLMSFFKVVLPVVRGSVLAAAILMWVTAISELSASIVVYTGGLETMPIAIFRQIDTARLGMASAYGSVLVTVILVPVILAAKFFRINLFSVK